MYGPLQVVPLLATRTALKAPGGPQRPAMGVKKGWEKILRAKTEGGFDLIVVPTAFPGDVHKSRSAHRL